LDRDDGPTTAHGASFEAGNGESNDRQRGRRFANELAITSSGEPLTAPSKSEHRQRHLCRLIWDVATFTVECCRARSRSARHGVRDGLK